MIPTPESILKKNGCYSGPFLDKVKAAMREYYSTHPGFTLDDLGAAWDACDARWMNEPAPNRAAYLKSVEKVSPWISVEQAPTSDVQDYLLAYDEGVTIGYYNVVTKKWIDIVNKKEIFPTLYRTLPQPPQSIINQQK